MPLALPTRSHTTRYAGRCIALCTGLAAFAYTASAHAAALIAEHACSAGDTSLPCRLDGLLLWLEAAAWFLAIVLLLVLGLAIHLYRKNKTTRPKRTQSGR